MTSRSQLHAVWLGLVALLGSACGSVVLDNGAGGAGGGAGGTGGAGGGCPEGAHCVACPIAEPQPGAPCGVVGLSCTYNEISDCAKSDAIATCDATGWTFTYDYEGCCEDPCACGGGCNPCPPDAPAPGDACDPSFGGFDCSYPVATPCGTQTETATCTAGAWIVSMPDCPMMGDCSAYTSDGPCSTDPACRWLEPGCGQPQAPEGCFPREDCTVGTFCANGGVCTEVTHNPCWDKDCDACGVAVDVCLFPPG